MTKRRSSLVLTVIFYLVNLRLPSTSAGFITSSADGCKRTRITGFGERNNGRLQASKDDQMGTRSNSRSVRGEKKNGSSPSSRSSDRPVEKNTFAKGKAYKQKTKTGRKDNTNSVYVQLNKKIISCDTAEDIIKLLASTSALTRTAGGGAINSVNFSTSIHRIARYLSTNKQERARTLSDPKFALFLASFAEAIAGMDHSKPLSSLKEGPPQSKPENSFQFTTREFTNLVWGLAKFQIVPPLKVLPMIDSAENTRADLVQTCLKLRSQILESQKTNGKLWLPTLSVLAAKLMDTVAYTMLEISKEETTATIQEAVNQLWSFASASRPNRQVFEHLGSTLIHILNRNQDTHPKPQEYTNTIYAFATAGFGGASIRRILELLVNEIDCHPTWIAEFKPQELANAAWGISAILNFRRETKDSKANALEQDEEDLVVVRILRHIARAMIRRCDDFKPQEVSNTVYAYGTLGFGVGAEKATKRNLNDYIILKSDDYDEDEKLVNEMLATVRVSVKDRMDQFKEQELNNLAYGCARINKCIPDIFMGIADEFGRRRRPVSGQDIGSSLWSFAVTDFFHEPSFRKLLSRIDAHAMQKWKPQEISNTVYAIGTAGIMPCYPKAFDNSLVPPNERQSLEQISQDPVTLAFAAAARELLDRPGDFKAQEIKDILWGFSKAGIRHPVLFRSVAEHLVGRETDRVPQGELHVGMGMDLFSSQEIANLCWAYAKQAQLSSENSELLDGRMAVFCSTAIDVGETLMKRLANCAVEVDLSKYGDLSPLTTLDLTNTLWSLGLLGLRFDNFIEAARRQIVSRWRRYLAGEMTPSTTFRGQEVSNILWSYSTMNAITPAMLDAAEPYIKSMCEDGSPESILAFNNQQELGNLAWSCTVAGHYPPSLVRLIQRGLLGETEKEQSPAYMAELHRQDGGLKDQTVMALLYMHYGMHLDGAKFIPTLPRDFPIGWGAFDYNGDAFEDESGICLSITTSRVQQDVAAAFTRIGLDLVQEYIVPARAFAPVDVLSLDIADISHRVGIEVDGPSHFCHNMAAWSPQDPPKGKVAMTGYKKVEYQFDWDSQRNLPNGSTMLKDRLLRKLGWKVIHIPFWDWYAMKGDHSAEDKYCRELLEDI